MKSDIGFMAGKCDKFIRSRRYLFGISNDICPINPLYHTRFCRAKLDPTWKIHIGVSCFGVCLCILNNLMEKKDLWRHGCNLHVGGDKFVTITSFWIVSLCPIVENPTGRHDNYMFYCMLFSFFIELDIRYRFHPMPYSCKKYIIH